MTAPSSRNMGLSVMVLSRKQTAAPPIPMGILLIRQKKPSLYSQVVHPAGTRQMRWISTQTPGTFLRVGRVMAVISEVIEQAMDQAQECRNCCFNAQDATSQSNGAAPGQ